MITKTKSEQDLDVVELKPEEYYKAVCGVNGSYTQEDRFDKSIGLKWLGKYRFAIINSNTWKQAKNKHNFS